MIQKLRNVQELSGATVAPLVGNPQANMTVVVSFDNDPAALQAVQSGVALSDRSHWGRILVSDSDRLRFLHNQSTNDFNQLQPGQGCDTVFVTSTGRTLDLATAYVLEDGVLLLVSPVRRQYLLDWMDRFIFFADRVVVKDVTAAIATFSLLGPASHDLVTTLGAGAILGQPYASHAIFSLAGIDIRIAVGSGLATEGYTVIVDADQAVPLWQQLIQAGAIPMGETVWERLRIEQGRPVPDRELTEEFNPLEAGLWQTISLTKGCYIGQETIARLHTYRGVKQQLWGVRLQQAVAPETTILLGHERIGKLTSCTPTETGYFGLAYIRTKSAEAGLTVQIGDTVGELVSVPFVSHQYL